MTTYSTAAKIAAHNALLALIDADAAAATLRLRTAANADLAVITLTDPAGSVDGAGLLTLTVAAREESATAGTVDHAVICDGAGTVIITLPAQAGTVAVAGTVVLNTLTLTAGSPVESGDIVVG